jgi:hypothetical protein
MNFKEFWLRNGFDSCKISKKFIRNEIVILFFFLFSKLFPSYHQIMHNNKIFPVKIFQIDLIYRFLPPPLFHFHPKSSHNIIGVWW